MKVRNLARDKICPEKKREQQEQAKVVRILDTQPVRGVSPPPLAAERVNVREDGVLLMPEISSTALPDVVTSSKPSISASGLRLPVVRRSLSPLSPAREACADSDSSSLLREISSAPVCRRISSSPPRESASAPDDRRMSNSPPRESSCAPDDRRMSSSPPRESSCAPDETRMSSSPPRESLNVQVRESSNTTVPECRKSTLIEESTSSSTSSSLTLAKEKKPTWINNSSLNESEQGNHTTTEGEKLSASSGLKRKLVETSEGEDRRLKLKQISVVNYELSDEDGREKTSVVDYESSEDEDRRDTSNKSSETSDKEMEDERAENFDDRDDDTLKLIFNADKPSPLLEDNPNEPTHINVPNDETKTSADKDDDSFSYEQFEIEVASIVRDRKENSREINADENGICNASPYAAKDSNEGPQMRSNDESLSAERLQPQEEGGNDVIRVEGANEEEIRFWQNLKREVESAEFSENEGEEDSVRISQILEILEREVESDKERGTVEEEESNTEDVRKYEEEEIVLYFGKH